MLKNNGFHNRHSPILRAFSPLSLFSGGAPGAWYDPSDYTTLFQDSAGTTPVTAVEQPVGLMLDKSQGLVLGSELVTNGDFSGGTTGWVSGTSLSSTAAVVSGEMQVTATASSGRQIQGITTTTGKSYKVTGLIRKISGGGVAAYLAHTDAIGSSNFSISATVSGSVATAVTLTFTASASTSYIGLSCWNSGDVCGFDKISVKELAGNHAFQATSASRPVLKIDGNGKLYLKFDGVDDSLSTNSISFTSTDKMSVFAGVRKLSDANPGIIVELSAVVDSNNGSFFLAAPGDVAAAEYRWRVRGTAQTNAIATTFASPITNTLTGLGDISGDRATIRVNGAQVAQSTADLGTGNFGNYPLFIGRRNNASLPFNGQMYSMVIVGKAVTAGELSSTETYVNQKTGAY